ncbi:uncharacterized protein [Haliotis asinina]|uniref:uncharacterized protein n=1 Tax=Haliotis asinina TaxID=109174 RepID=UPI003532296A
MMNPLPTTVRRAQCSLVNYSSFIFSLLLITSKMTRISAFVIQQSPKCRIDYHNLPASVSLEPGCSHVTCGSHCGAPCPSERDCQQNGVLVCKVPVLPVAFTCGYDDTSCYVFQKVTSCTNEGTVAPDGSCVCPVGFMGHLCQHYVHTCADIYQRDSSSADGEYTFITSQDDVINVYCRFKSNVVTTYFSKDAVTKLNTQELRLHYNSNTAVDLAAKLSDGTQSESTLAQMTTFSTVPLRVMISENTDYSAPSNENLGAYLFLGFLPEETISAGVRHGFNANGVDQDFVNCDEMSHSYFTFFSNMNSMSPQITSGGMCSDCIMAHWQTDARMLQPGDYLPDNYIFDTEIHFGGCGGFGITTSWSNVDGFGLGVKYAEPFGGSSVMEWGCISYDCKLNLITIQGTLNGHRYQQEVLEAAVVPHFDNHPSPVGQYLWTLMLGPIVPQLLSHTCRTTQLADYLGLISTQLSIYGTIWDVKFK